MVANREGKWRWLRSQEVAPGAAGRYFEDFTVGDVYEHRPGRTISEADNTWFTLLTMNQHPLHFDAGLCRESRNSGGRWSIAA